MIIFRLAPQDYHRFHAPMNATVLSITPVSGGLQSVNADAMRAEDDAIYNERLVVILGTQYGRVAYVAIGAACVGSIVFTPNIGDTVVKGQDVGTFQFGGSTIALLFEPNRILLDDDLSFNSADSVETLVRVGQRIGIAH